MRKRPEYDASSAHALLAARAVERLAGWACRPRCDLAPSVMPCLGIDPRADALLIAAGDAVRAQPINALIEEARLDALIVACGQAAGSPLRAHLVLWRDRAPAWHDPGRFWASPLDDLWIAIDGQPGDQRAVRLAHRRLIVSTLPSSSPDEICAGFARADAAIARQMEALR